MSLTYEQAGKAIIAHVDSNWGTPVEYENIVLENKPDKDTWARLTIQYVRGYGASLGGKHFRRDGITTLQIFIVKNDPRGPAYIDQLSDQAVTMFEGVQLPGGLKFYGDITPIRLDNIQEGYYQINVVVNFKFDEIRI